MNSMPLAAAAAIATLAAAVPAAAAIDVTNDPVLYWNDQAQALVAAAGPIQSRTLAMTNIAIHDAVNATVGHPDRSYLLNVVNRGGDTRAAASQAAHNVLVALDPGHAATYDADLAASLALVGDGTAKSHGIATGAAFAAAVLAKRASDGSAAVVPYTTTGLPGDWRPTPTDFKPAALPQWGGVTPFLLASGDQLRPGPPPALGSAEYAAAYDEVKDIGAAASTTRTADQAYAAKFWASASAVPVWTRIGLTLADGAGLSTIENARTFALLSTTMADSLIAGYDSKYYYRLWRPVTAIQLGDSDGNDTTVGDPGWMPLVTTPNFPGYMSTHSTLSPAAADILASVFGNDDMVCITLSVGPDCWANVETAAVDASNSRVWGGIHFRFDTDTGLAVGHQLSSYVLASGAFGAVPEPASWAMLVAGFAIVGTAVRRRGAWTRVAS